MKERLIIVFVAVIIGLIVTTAAFFLYQSTLNVKKEEGITKSESKTNSKNTTDGKLFITIDEPKNESVVSTRTIQIKGRTNNENTLIASSNQEDVVANPTEDGTYAITLSIEVGTNKIIVRAVNPDGEEVQETRIVSFTTEEF